MRTPRREAESKGRIVRYEHGGVQYEPDLVHAKTVIRELGLEDAEPALTPMADHAHHTART